MARARRNLTQGNILRQLYGLTWPMLFGMIGNNIVRATGDTFTPGIILVAIAVVNGILDPFYPGSQHFPGKKEK